MIKINRENLIYCELGLLFLLGMAQIFSASNWCLVIVFVLIIFMFFANLETSMIMLFVALPFFNLFNQRIGSTSLFYLFILIFIYKYFKYKNFTISKKKILFFFLLVLVRIPSGDFIGLFKWILLLLVPVLVYNEKFISRNIENLVFYFTMSAILSSIFGYHMLQQQISIYTHSYVYSNDGITTRFAGLIGDSVFYAQFVAVIVSANLVIALYNKKKSIKHSLLGIILGFFNILTYSKTGIILLIVVYGSFTVAYIILNLNSKKTLIKSILIFLLSGIGSIFIIRYIISHTDNIYINNYIIRFTSADLSTGRNVVTEHYLELLGNSWRTPFIAMSQEIYSNPFFTHGTTSINRAHNIYIESVCAFGLIATLIIFSWIFYLLYKNIFKYKHVFSTLPLLVLLASGLVLHGHFEFQYYFLVIISLEILNYYPNVDNRILKS